VETASACDSAGTGKRRSTRLPECGAAGSELPLPVALVGNLSRDIGIRFP